MYRKLIDEFNFKAKIPTCKQLENNIMNDDNLKQLTIKQTTESRLVTKVKINQNKFFFSKNSSFILI